MEFIMKTGFYIILISFIFLTLSCEDTKSVNNCGNESIDTGEECDGEELGDTCQTMGFYYGTLSCRDDCTLNLSQCNGECGDDILQSERGEQCEPSTFSTVTCVSVGLGGGTITQCNSSCKFDLSNCTGECGDGTIQEILSEDCEFGDLNGQTCETLGYHGGSLSCNNVQCSFELSDCEPYGSCGDGIIQETYETCDGSVFLRASCRESEYLGGIIGCNDSCSLDCLYFTKIESGWYHTCAIDNEDRLWCWGRNLYGQLGIGTDATEMDLPAMVDTDATFIEINAGAEHTCAIDSNNDMWCWGSGLFGQLGITSFNIQSSNVPVKVETDKKFQKVAGGQNHNCAIELNGEVWCWGTNANAQLGNNDTADSSTLVKILNNNSFSRLSAGSLHTCAIDDASRLWCWGWNNFGQLGTNDSTNYYVPTMVDSTVLFNEIECGSGHNCAIDATGYAWCWGEHSKGRLGLSVWSGNEVLAPEKVDSNSIFVSISAANSHTCAIDDGGQLWCWGNEFNGRLGIGPTSAVVGPQAVSSTEQFVKITTGQEFTCGLTDTFGYCWGKNDKAQLGYPVSTLSSTDIPLEINTLIEDRSSK
jgi:alpha-tubulin suppressor-like RCC1 family protein